MFEDRTPLRLAELLEREMPMSTSPAAVVSGRQR
jgi:hypothetical protein